MKSMVRRLSLVLLLMPLLLVFCAAAKPEKIYDEAQSLLAHGKYAEAAEKFGSIGSYEDASVLAMYCKACALAESGHYDIAITALQQMGDFKDCPMRVVYYSARSYEESAGEDDWESLESAIALYNQYPLFMDCFERSTSLLNKVEGIKSAQYDSAVAAGESGQWDVARNLFIRLGTYRDSAERIPYYELRHAETVLVDSVDQDLVLAVAEMYGENPDYLDCGSRSETMRAKADRIVAGKYEQVTALIAEGKCSEAEHVLVNFGEYGGDKIKDCYVAIAEKYIEMGQWDEAYTAYVLAGWGTDAFKAYYDKAETMLGEGNWEEASEAFKEAGSYKDAKKRINEPFYRQGEVLLDSGDEAGAIAAFKRAGSYSDAVKRYQAVYYVQAERYLIAGQWEESSAAFVKAESYLDAKSRINEPYYRQGESLMAEGKWAEASSAFKKAGSYKDAKERINEPFYRQGEVLLDSGDEAGAIAAFKRAGAYSDAVQCYQAIYYTQAERYLSEGKWAEASAAFRKAGSYKDAKERINEPFYRQGEVLLDSGDEAGAIAAFKRAGAYSNAVQCYQAIYYTQAERYLSEGKWAEASAAFRKASSYKDAKERIGEPYYKQAEILMAAEDWLGAAAAFKRAGDYGDAVVRIKEANYKHAEALLAAGNYQEAFEVFCAISYYQNSSQRAQAIYFNALNPDLMKAEVGSHVEFGTYDQDNNKTNGAEPISWIVLERTDNRLFLVSTDVLDCKPFNNRYTKVRWENSTLNTWLNVTFFYEAFSEFEQALIQGKNPVSLLSLEDVYKYSLDKKFVSPTVRALYAGVMTNHNDPVYRSHLKRTDNNCSWWLCTSGDYLSEAYVVMYNGKIYETNVNYDGAGVRPVIWISVPTMDAEDGN